MRVLSGIQPTGAGFHLGSWLGAIRQYVTLTEGNDCFYAVVDLHALTAGWDPTTLAARTRESAIELLASGVDPSRATLFVQSHVPQHSELLWILESLTGFGEAGRMTQFKDKSARGGDPTVGLFTYPVLQAADILLYDAEAVPVGDDQRQHLELTRNLAQRFNSRLGETLVVPEALVPKGVSARVMDLSDPTAKMSKSLPAAGTIYLTDTPAAARKKIMRATTDSDTVVRAAPEKPGVTNLLGLLSELTGRDVPALEVAFEGHGYGALKGALADAVAEFLAPYQQRVAELTADPDGVDAVLAAGADRARAVAGATLARVRDAVGFLPVRG